MSSTVKPKLLDLCCCEGGAAAGYIRAGWDVTGVDLEKKFKKRYPGSDFNVANALDFGYEHGKNFDAIHASPPCQGYTRGNAGRETKWPKLIPDFREMLTAIGKPYVIENVRDAEYAMVFPISLCGCMFNLSTTDTDGVTIYLQRLRLFETNWDLSVPRSCDHSEHEWVAGAYGGARRDKYEAKYVRKGGYVPREKEVVKALLGVEHDMTWNGLFECVPPAYTAYIGDKLLAVVQ